MNEFKPARMLAFDFMPEMVALAKQRDVDAEFFVGDVTNIDLPSEHVDAVFIFAILHHVPAWKKALLEVGRVLKSKGILLIEELEGPLVQNIDKYFRTEHPPEAFFTWPEFRKGLEQANFNILDSKQIVHKGCQSFICQKMDK